MKKLQISVKRSTICKCFTEYTMHLVRKYTWLLRLRSRNLLDHFQPIKLIQSLATRELTCKNTLKECPFVNVSGTAIGSDEHLLLKALTVAIDVISKISEVPKNRSLNYFSNCVFSFLHFWIKVRFLVNVSLRDLTTNLIGPFAATSYTTENRLGAHWTF